MSFTKHLHTNYEDRLVRRWQKLRWRKLHIDPILLTGLIALAVTGIFILISASNENPHMVLAQVLRFGLSFVLMLAVAQISPHRFAQWAPWLYGIAVFLLFAVLIVGQVDLGARRWFNFHFFHFQPSEIMMITMPIALAWYFRDRPLPPSPLRLIVSSALILVPALLIAKEPDLGTAIIIAFSGFIVLVLAGMSWRIIASLLAAGILSTPMLWHFMHPYQKERVLTFLNPERDPLGAGYHIIQSKIAIGSGGFFGKGWLHGTQSHLSFLPAHATDFIFAVSGEELGFIGALFILLLFLTVLARCLYISITAQDTFTRLLGGSISLTFIVSALINIGMVIGILPVVGIPLPLISYGGSSMLTTMIGFGILMSIQTHRKLF